MTIRLLPFSIAALLILGACTSDPQQAALEQYLSDGEEIAQDISEAGTRFETLMNIQGNALSWTDDEKTELSSIVASLDVLQMRAETLSVPDILLDIHPLLIQAIVEISAAVDGVAVAADDPSKVTEQLINEIAKHTTDGEAFAHEYADKLEKAVSSSNPDLADNI